MTHYKSKHRETEYMEMKKINCLLLLILMFIIAIPAAANAAYGGVCGTNGNNLTWTLDDSGTLTISGRGEMADYSVSSMPWYLHRSNIQKVIIEENVTTIGNFSFYDCENLNRVTIPDSVTDIGDNAFNGCYYLGNVTIPDSVNIIGIGAFGNCQNLTYIKIPDSVMEIGNNAFYRCINLSYIEMSKNVKSVGYDVFSNTSYYNNSVNWENGVLYIDKVLIKAKNTLSGNYEIKEGTTVVAGSAFSGCGSITAVTVPDSIIYFGADAFLYCSALTSINVDENNLKYKSEKGVLFDKDKTVLIQYPVGITDTDYIIPDGVTTVGNSAFYDCGSLKSIIIPDSIMIIEDYAFHNCNALEVVNYMGTAGEWGVILKGEYNDSLLKSTINCDYKMLLYITFNANGGTNAPETLEVMSDSVAVIPDTVPVLDKYEFLGWATSQDMADAEYQPGSRISVERKDITLYAVWKRIIKLDVSVKNNVIMVNPDNAPENCVIVCAYYDNERMVYVDDYVYDGGFVPFYGMVNYDTVKIMVIDNMDNLKPLCDAVTI